MSARTATWSAALLVTTLCVISCYSTGDGPTPPAGTLYFPVGVAVSPGGNVLYVANSDFDLQFNSGTVDAYDLPALRTYWLHFWDASGSSAGACTRLGLGLNTAQTLIPGPCTALDLANPTPQFAAISGSTKSIVRTSARIGAFATDLLFVCHPAENLLDGRADCSGTKNTGAARLFVPVRGDPSITFFDVPDDRGVPVSDDSFALNCDQQNNDGRCADSHRIGIDPAENLRGLTLPTEPFDIAVSDRADALVVTHQLPNGALSLITGRSTQGNSVLDVNKPILEYVLTGLRAAATGVSTIPIPGVVVQSGALDNYQEGFVVAYRGAAQADTFRFFDDRFAAPQRPFLTGVSSFPLTVTPIGIDSRSVAIDRTTFSDRAICEQSCTSSPPAGQSTTACLTTCSQRPLPIMVANRAPPALLIGDLTTPNPTSSFDSLSFYDSVPLAPGASRVVMGTIRNAAGKPEPRAFVICFDARLVFVYDPIRRRLDGEIRTGRGPHSFVVDPQAPLAYLGHFTDSYIGVIDLDQAHPDTYASMIGIVGVPQAPQGTR